MGFSMAMRKLWMLFLLPYFAFADCVGTGGYFTVHDQKGVLVSQHTQIYKAVEKAIEINGTIKSPDIVCSGKASSSQSSSSSMRSSSSSSVRSSSSQSYSSSSQPSGGSWTVRANFENGALGSRAAGSDAFSGNTQAIISDEVTSVSGSKVAKTTITAGEAGWGKWGGTISFPTPLKRGDEVLITVHVWWPSGFSYAAEPHLKFLRVKTPSGYNDIYIENPKYNSTQPYKFIYEGEQVWSRIGESKDAIKFDVWEKYEFYIKFDNVSEAAGGMANVKFWKNGVLLAETKQRKTLGTADQQATDFYLFTYWNGLNSPTQSLYIDDITIKAN